MSTTTTDTTPTLVVPNDVGRLVKLAFTDYPGHAVNGPASGAVVSVEDDTVCSATLQADGQSVLVLPLGTSGGPTKVTYTDDKLSFSMFVQVTQPTATSGSFDVANASTVPLSQLQGSGTSTVGGGAATPPGSVTGGTGTDTTGGGAAAPASGTDATGSGGTVVGSGTDTTLGDGTVPASGAPGATTSDSGITVSQATSPTA